MSTTDLYSTLNVSKTSSLEDIKKAYKKLAIRYHPDKCLNENDKDTNEAKFKEINQAYSILSDPDKRRNYDQFGTIENNVQDPNMSMDDILKDIFGGGHTNGMNSSFSFMFMDGMGNVQQGGSMNMFGQSQRQMKKQDTIEVQIDINDIFYGQTKKVEFEILDKCDVCDGKGAQDPSHILKCMTCQGNGMVHQQIGPFFSQAVTCPSCAGQGTTVQHNKHCSKCKGKKTFYNKKLFELKLPKGIPNNYEVVMEGKGAYNQQANTNNDIRFRFIYNVNERYILEENKTVHYHTSITLEELLGGFTKDIEIYKEHIVLKSDYYFNPTKTLVLHGMGLYDMKGEKQRDLHIHFNIIYSDNERYKKYADVMKKVLKVSKDDTSNENTNTNKNVININEFL
jgi:molecular chaperone DnaJ